MPEHSPACTVFAELFAVHRDRSPGQNTLAVRELVLGSMEHGANIQRVVRPLPIGALVKQRRLHGCGRHGLPFDVVDVPKAATALRVAGLLCRSLSPDIRSSQVAICHMVGGFLLARQVLRGSPVPKVLVLHQSDFRTPGLLACLKEADRVYCRSEAIRQRLQRISPRQIDGIVFSGIPEDLFVRREFVSNLDELILVSAGLLVPGKNFDAVLKALSMLPQSCAFRYHVLGDGPERRSLEDLAVGLGIADRVAFHGFVPRAEVLRTMRMSDLFVMPSAPETFGLAFLEAMSQGCVVIGHRNWGIDGTISHGHDGFLVERADPVLIAQAINSYLHGDRAGLHRNAMTLAGGYTTERAYRNYAQVIAEAAG